MVDAHSSQLFERRDQCSPSSYRRQDGFDDPDHRIRISVLRTLGEDHIIPFAKNRYEFDRVSKELCSSPSIYRVSGISFPA